MSKENVVFGEIAEKILAPLARASFGNEICFQSLYSSEIMGENVTHKQKRGYEHVGFSLASLIAVGSLRSEASLSRLHNSDGKEHLIALMA